MRVKKLPQILALHLKRFKYVEQQQRFNKLSHRVTFPLQLRLFNTVSFIKYRKFKVSLNEVQNMWFYAYCSVFFEGFPLLCIFSKEFQTFLLIMIDVNVVFGRKLPGVFLFFNTSNSQVNYVAEWFIQLDFCCWNIAGEFSIKSRNKLLLLKLDKPFSAQCFR